MVLIPVPSHTMIKGASADFGKEFKIIKKGSRMSDIFGKQIRKIADRTDIIVTDKKLMIVSARVILMCLHISLFSHIFRNKAITFPGLLKKKLSIRPKEELISHIPRKEKSNIKRDIKIINL